MILVLDDVINNKDANICIKAHSLSKQYIKQHPCIEPISYENCLFLCEDVLYVFEKILTKVYSYFPNIVYNWGEIVKWPNGSKIDIHKDRVTSGDIFTTVTYLNDDFTGGCTRIIDGTTIAPKTGRTLLFDGTYYAHEVTKVEGIRYSIPIWYKKRTVD